eukprot:8737762-Alexandrium_andersonii.AAC.1
MSGLRQHPRVASDARTKGDSEPEQTAALHDGEQLSDHNEGKCRNTEGEHLPNADMDRATASQHLAGQGSRRNTVNNNNLWPMPEWPGPPATGPPPEN